MTDYKKYINALRKCAKEHEDDKTSFGHIIVSDLCNDTANLLESLEQEPTAKEDLVVEDCISREEVCDYIAEFVNHEYATDRERELVKNIIDGIQHLPSIQPKTDVLDKIMKEIKEIYADIDDVCIKNGLNLARRIINKYKAESEDKE